MARNQISSIAFGQVNSAVRILPGASVNVASQSGAPVTLYQTEDGSETVSNPFTCDALGRYEFFVSSTEVSYTITVTLGPVSYSWVFYTPDNTAAAGLIYEETWSDLVGRTANLDGAAAEVTDDAGMHLDATATGYDGGEVANLGRYRWNEEWGRWQRLDDLSPVLFGQPYESVAALEAARVPGTISSILVVVDETVLRYVRSDDPADIQSADAQWWSLVTSPIEAGGTGGATAAEARVNLGIYLTADLTVNIPTDYATLQAAVDATQYVGPNGFNIYLNIETGHAPTGGISVSDGDYRHYIIVSDDATVTVDATFPDADCIVKAENASAPRLECKIDMNGQGDNGYYLINSSGYVAEGCGVDNSGGLGEVDVTGTGLFLRNSSICYAKNTVFNGHIRNLWVTHESLCFADNANFDGGTGDTNIYVARGSIAGISYGSAKNGNGSGIRIRRARAVAMTLDVSGNGAYGALVVENSRLNLSQGALEDNNGADMSNCGSGALLCDGSEVQAYNSDMRSPGANCINVDNGGRVLCSGATIGGTDDLNRASRGIYAQNGSLVIAEEVTIADVEFQGVYALNSKVEMGSGGTIQNCNYGVEADQVSDVNARTYTITTNRSRGVRSNRLSRVNLDGSTVQNNTGNDYDVFNGGQIMALNTTTSSGSPSTSDANVAAFNTWQSNGVVWA